MNKFAIAFRKARLNSDLKFRQIKEEVGLSIGYLSDIENGKRNPPEISIVEKFEKCFDIYDKHLVRLAKIERASNPHAIGHLIESKPELKEVLFRLDALPKNEFEDLLNELRKNVEGDDPWFLVSKETMKYFFKGQYSLSI